MFSVARKAQYNNILVNRVAITLALASTVVISLRFSAGTLHPLGTIASLSVIVVLFSVAILSGKKISANTGAWILVIMCWLAVTVGGYAAGGINAPATIVFTLIPLAAAYLLDIRATIIMCILCITSVLILFIIDLNGYAQPVTIEESKLELVKAAWLIFVIFLVSIMGWFYNKNTGLLTQALEEQASTDFLTQLANRRRLNEMLEQEFNRMRRFNNWLTILMVDIDYFKKFNDEEGHVKGDESLILVANCIKEFCQRSTDVVGRYGGEEFLLILPDMEPDNAKTLSENILIAVRKIHIECIKPENENLTVTIGCLSVCDTDLNDPKDLIAQCDKLLYKGKNDGRNRVISHAEISKQSMLKN